MTITSLEFAAFVMVVFAVFAICPRKSRWIVLLAGSMLFYVIAGPEFVPFLVATIISIWLSSAAIGRIWERQRADFDQNTYSPAEKKCRRQKDQRKAKAIVILAVCINIGYLILEKALLYRAARASDLSAAARVIVPLGISYYSFSTVGYLLDVYWKRYDYERNVFRFALYAAYFPHITQGPISRYNLLGQELKKELTLDYTRVTQGLQLVLWGVCKKLVIADRAMVFVSEAFAVTDGEGMAYLIALALDVVQIYADFSGYMDIMRGVSELFGVELERNFDHPFQARSVSEFWRRWHMTLGGWFKDYVYYPITISGWHKRISKWSKQCLSPRMAKLLAAGIPIMTTWLLTGIWHGNGVGYVAWGIYYGTLITASVVWSDVLSSLPGRIGIRTDCFSYRLFQMLRTGCIFAGGRLLTKGGSFSSTLRIIRQIITNTHVLPLFTGEMMGYGLNGLNWQILIIGICLQAGVELLQVKGEVRGMIARQNLPFRWMLYLAGMLVVLVYGVYGSAYSTEGFAYQNF